MAKRDLLTASSDFQRVVSLLPSATEMMADLGLAECLSAVSHACDFPRGIGDIPVITKSIVPPGLSSQEIDQFVSHTLHEGRSLYTVDDELLREIAPDVVITQALCDVCAVNYETVTRIVGRLENQPQLVSLNPTCFEEIFSDLLHIGAALHVEDESERLVSSARERLKTLEQQVAGTERPRVLSLEWYEPPFFGGHWVPEQIVTGGGISVVGAPRERSERLSWSTIHELDPDVILLMPCGYDLQQSVELADELRGRPEWEKLRAVKERRVFALDANSCFSRPSMRVVLGAELVGHVLHPDRVPPPSGNELFAPLFGRTP